MRERTNEGRSRKLRHIYRVKVIYLELITLMDSTVKVPAAALYALLPVFFFSSCAWNKAFLAPDKIPTGLKAATSTDPATGDPIIMHFSGQAHQPTVTFTDGAPYPLPYSVESILFNSDGKQLNGWMMKSNDTIKAPEITMLFLHGNGGNLLTEYPIVIPFLQRGFQVFIFDYSGFGFSEGKASRKHVLIDAQAALAYLHARKDVRGLPLVIYGQSLGGHTAAVMADRTAGLASEIVIEGGFSSFKSIGQATTHIGPLSLLIHEGPRATRSIKNYFGPLLVIHSDDDSVVPLSMGKALYDSGNQPKQFHVIHGPHANGPFVEPDSIATWIKAMIR